MTDSLVERLRANCPRRSVDKADHSLCINGECIYCRAADQIEADAARITQLQSLENNVRGIWQAFPGIRADIGNTNYAVVQDKLCELAVGDDH